MEDKGFLCVLRVLRVLVVQALTAPQPALVSRINKPVLAVIQLRLDVWLK
jgi:hypothetical protein